MQTSVYSELLAALLKHSLILDSAGEAAEQFTPLQRLEARIINAHNDGYITGDDQRALYAVAMKLHEDYRKALDLDIIYESAKHNRTEEK